MATATGKFYDWDKNPRMSVAPLPERSCDRQFHIYEDPAKFPPQDATVGNQRVDRCRNLLAKQKGD